MENNSKSKITPYLYLVPCMLIFGIFLFYPFVKTIYLSLYKTNKMGQAKLKSALPLPEPAGCNPRGAC